jgi:hypothetical protein
VKPQSLAEMQPRERHLALVAVTARVVLAWIVFVGGYFILPIGNDWNDHPLIRVLVVAVVVVVFIVWSTARITRAKYPELRAVEALGSIIALFLVLFAATYLAMFDNSASTFTQPLDHMSSLYFTVTVFSTVGFGDITAKTDTARAVVSLQMVLDLVLIGIVVRLLFTAAKRGLGRPVEAS